MTSSLPILYSFRRCPYAIRARMAIKYSGQTVELREVILREMPVSMLEASPKGTVPVLVLPDGRVIEESLEVMHWALAIRDDDQWLSENNKLQAEANLLIEENDTGFKSNLDHYKYADRYPEHTVDYYRTECERFLKQLDMCLADNHYLLSDHISIADIGLFPFIRQFSLVDKGWFDASPYQQLQQWLDDFLQSDSFAAVMQKYPVWESGQDVIAFP